jgi:putative CRISPR-associated protein (TIGR02620 family)
VNNWPEINALDAALAQIRKNELLIVTRHGGLVDWLKSKGYDGRVVDRATPADILGKHVIGSLPLHYSAIAASITSIAIPGCPQERRGEELSAEELDMYGAFLRTYTVKEITMIEPI